VNFKGLPPTVNGLPAEFFLIPLLLWTIRPQPRFTRIIQA
jgi:hypothetical protein